MLHSNGRTIPTRPRLRAPAAHQARGLSHPHRLPPPDSTGRHTQRTGKRRVRSRGGHQTSSSHQAQDRRLDPLSLRLRHPRPDLHTRGRDRDRRVPDTPRHRHPRHRLNRDRVHLTLTRTNQRPTQRRHSSTLRPPLRSIDLKVSGEHANLRVTTGHMRRELKNGIHARMIP